MDSSELSIEALAAMKMNGKQNCSACPELYLTYKHTSTAVAVN